MTSIAYESEIEENVDSDMGSIHSDDESAGSGEDDQPRKSGWADSMAKVLKSSKPLKKKSIVLSRAKKLPQKDAEEKLKPKPLGFEIDGEEKDEKPTEQELVSASKKPRNVALSLRSKPSIHKDLETEKALKKIATRGVVQLFNAVRMQQKELDQQIKEAGKLDHKRDEVLENINKRKFLDKLMTGDRAKSVTVGAGSVKKEEDDESDYDDEDGKKSEWGVLRDDFMTNKKMKNWDQEESDQSGNEGGGNASSGSDSDE